MATAYHGSSALFDRFDPSHILEGDGKEYIGSNLMGRLLMELRDNGKLDYVLPSDAVQPTSNKGKRGRPPKPQTENS